MPLIAAGLAILAAISGLLSARFWKKSSNVPIDPNWYVAPEDECASTAGWQAATMTAFSQAAALNWWAAVWAYCAAGCAVLSALIGVVSYLLG